MSLQEVPYLWDSASDALESVIADLSDIRRYYLASNLEPCVVVARVAALESKIAALRAVMLSHAAYPWSEDLEVTA